MATHRGGWPTRIPWLGPPATRVGETAEKARRGRRLRPFFLLSKWITLRAEIHTHAHGFAGNQSDVEHSHWLSPLGRILPNGKTRGFVLSAKRSGGSPRPPATRWLPAEGFWHFLRSPPTQSKAPRYWRGPVAIGPLVRVARPVNGTGAIVDSPADHRPEPPRSVPSLGEPRPPRG
jgi:hypothetical protein